MTKLRIRYLGWLGQGNLGDETTFEVFKYLLKSHLTIPYELTASQDIEGKFDLVVVGSGTLLSAWNYGWEQRITEVKNRGIPYVIFGTGVQRLDYNHPEHSITSEGIQVLADIINNSKLTYVRFPDTIKTLKSVGGKNVNLMNDLVFSYPIKIEQNLKEPNLIGFNIGIDGCVQNNIFGKNESKFIEEAIDFIKYLIYKDYRVLLFPMCGPDLGVQHYICDKINSPNLRANNLLSTKETLKLMQKFEFVIAEKLHASIFSALLKIPFMTLAYRPKCIEFCNSIKLAGVLIKTDEMHKALEKFNYLWSVRNEIKNHLNDCVPEIQELNNKAIKELINFIGKYKNE